MVIRKSKARPIKEVIHDYLRQSNLKEGLNQQELMRLWHESTGKIVERNTESLEVRDRKLIVKVKSSVVRNELSMVRDGLIKELNDHFPEPLIDDIVLR